MKIRKYLSIALALLLLILAACAAETEVPVATEPSSTAITEPPTAEAVMPLPEMTEPTEPETLPQPTPITKVSTARIVATGDLLMHLPVINSGLQRDGSYDFTSTFQYLAPYVTAADYGVINLETTLAGTSYPYSGYPKFNCPDGIVTSAAAAGFDMLLTANNHCNDTGTTGFNRTLQVIAENGLVSLGTKATIEEPDYQIVTLNGISLGLICYTYTVPIESGQPNVNGLPLTEDTASRINLFDYENLDVFYARFQQQMDAMAEDGAEAVVLFIHWGEEYQLTPNRYQKAMAQALCDLGVDVIIGNHPHVVQSLELLTASNNPNHRTICLYSTGNALSNQRKGSVSALKTAHMEDGVLFSVTFARYSDGSVVLEDVDALPFWVYRKGSGGNRQYYLLPLDSENRDNWQTLYNLNGETTALANESWQRTMDQLNVDLEELRSHLRQTALRPHSDFVISESDKKQKQE